MNCKLQSLLLAAVVMTYLASSVAAIRMRRAPVDRTGSGTSGQQGGGTTSNGVSYKWTRLMNNQEFMEEAYATSGDMSIVRMRSYPSDDQHTHATIIYDFDGLSPVLVVKPFGFYSPCFVFYDPSMNYNTIVNELAARDSNTGSVLSDALNSRGFDGTGVPLTASQKADLFSGRPVVEADCGFPADRVIVNIQAVSDTAAISNQGTSNVDFLTVFADNRMVIPSSYVP